MMRQTTAALPVSGTVAADSDGAMLVLSERLDGHDTFLTGQLELDDHTMVAVRILTLDDVTVLRYVDGSAKPPLTAVWAGVLHLPHGWRTRAVPDDLAVAASRAGRDLGALDEAELRYALTFLDEATTDPIRAARITAIVSAIPVVDGGPA
jgi:hypothetical protein